MMLEMPKCRERRCAHFTGIISDDDYEKNERPACKAFPDGIPPEIGYGDNPHTEPFEGDGGILFSELATNVYCPTGIGGGKDPTCSPGGVHHGGGKQAHLVDTKRDAEGKLSLADGSALPEHLQHTAIPPAWTDVRVSPSPDADIQIRGVDKKGREQLVYSEKHKAEAAAKKFARTKELLEKSGSIRAENRRNMRSSDDRTREAASVMALIEYTGMRPGGHTDTGAEKKAYGATSILGRHVTKTETGVRLEYTGKKGVARTVDIGDPKLTKMLLDRKKRAGEDGKLFNTDDDKLRTYSKKLDGGMFKPKDFRTAVGTRTAIEIVKNMPRPKTQKEYKKQVKEVATEVSKRLGNTPTVALQSYIDPTVFSKWRVE